MKSPTPIRVECHSGYKADEYPKCFYLNENKYEIKEIADRWYQGDANPEYPVTNYFKVVTVSGERFILKHEVEKDEWYMI
ncbi:MAG: hypothetical protein JW973_18640 [Bacteroidales bacterium]|nr:hypothetical protein [Bacteroidales bacterium]